MYCKELTEAETLVMKCIWNAGDEISVQGVIDQVEAIYGKAMKRTTASTFILRLRDKGYIEGRQEGRNVFYHAVVSEEDYKRSRAKDYLEFWYDGSLSKALATLCESANMPEEKIEDIMNAINGLE